MSSRGELTIAELEAILKWDLYVLYVLYDLSMRSAFTCGSQGAPIRPTPYLLPLTLALSLPIITQ
jgi:hypothetical protein